MNINVTRYLLEKCGKEESRKIDMLAHNWNLKSVCLCVSRVSVYLSVCLSDCLFDGQDKFKLTRFIFIRLEVNYWFLIICYCSQACGYLTRFLWCVCFRELYKELYQKQREEAEVEKQVSGPNLVGEQSSPLHHRKQVLSNHWLSIFVFLFHRALP